MCIFCNNPAGIMRLTERGYEEPDFKAMVKEMVGDDDDDWYGTIPYRSKRKRSHYVM